jgi:chemotaxis protein methyltransferase CheR
MTAVSSLAWRLREMSDTEYRRFAEYVHDSSGISLNDSKRALVARRLHGRMRELGIESLADYTDFVRSDVSGAETVKLLDLIATNETHFFRERPHWDFLARDVLPRWVEEAAAGTREKRIRAWSAACSSGQEPYSLAMQLLEFMPPADGWVHEIHATDISTHVLDKARRAEWPIDKAPEIPSEYLQRYMLRGVGAHVGVMRAGREVRELVKFSRLNLHDQTYAVPGQFDLIFCRNVLIYFTPEGRAEVIERLTSRLSPGGLLFVGHAESLHAHRERLRPVLPTVYARAA